MRFFTYCGPRRPHYLLHNSLPILPVLSQISPVHVNPNYLFKFRSNDMKIKVEEIKCGFRACVSITGTSTEELFFKNVVINRRV